LFLVFLDYCALIPYLLSAKMYVFVKQSAFFANAIYLAVNHNS